MLVYSSATSAVFTLAVYRYAEDKAVARAYRRDGPAVYRYLLDLFVAVVGHKHVTRAVYRYREGVGEARAALVALTRQLRLDQGVDVDAEDGQAVDIGVVDGDAG